jgi:hypothetical protein
LGSLREGEYSEDLSLDRIILKWISKTWVVGSMDWIYVAHDTDRWRALVKGIMNLRNP